MLLPESMSRIVIVGNKSRLDDAIDVLYDVKAIHLIDYFNDSDDGFEIGAPRPYSSKASERLLKIRAVEKELSVSKKMDTYPVAADTVREQITSGAVEAVEKDVFRVLDQRNHVLQTVEELKARKSELEELSRIPLSLESYRGYDSLAVMVGTVKADPSAALAGLKDSEFFISNNKKLVAVFVPKADKDDAQKLLADFGYAEFNVPEGTGTPSDNLKDVDASLAKFSEELMKLESEVSALREEHETFLLATDEELSIQIEKGEIPLRIATSEFSFVVDAWIPTKQVDSVGSELNARLGDSVYVEFEETRGRDAHEEEHAAPRFKKTPTKMKNGQYGEKFEYPTKLISTPKYNEIDPSTIIAVFFPLFFGFMVGDVGYAIPFIILGAYGLKVAKSDEFKAIATVLFFGGIWAFIFGFFMFAEMFGMHFIGTFHAGDNSVTWEALLGVTFPDWFSGLFIETSPGHYGIGKLAEINFLLKLSVYIGIFHLLFSYIVGFANVKMQHGMKEAFFEKGGWIISFIGLVMFCWALTEYLISGNPFEGMQLYIAVVSVVLLLLGIAINWKREKALAIIELIGVVGNILSYTRLAAIGMSKAGMALAFNYISIIMLAGFGGEISMVGVVFGALIFVVGHLMIWVLAIISAGLHALRLQYVEMMNKFFVGGGTEYSPLAIKRKHTKIVETEV